MKTKALFALLLLAVFRIACAEGGTCPDGYYPVGGQGVAGCAPIPNYDAPASAARRQAHVWEDRWGSIAADFPGGKFGVARSMPNKQLAEHAAMADCRNEGGKNCSVDLAYYNQCGVIAWGSSYAATASAPTIEQAAIRALEVCGEASENCKIYHADCSLPVKTQ